MINSGYPLRNLWVVRVKVSKMLVFSSGFTWLIALEDFCHLIDVTKASSPYMLHGNILKTEKCSVFLGFYFKLILL
jgi:hypothetical protein